MNYFQDKKKMMTEKLLEVLGYPCALINSKGKNLKDYRIYGNCVQDGTPTPDTPIEVLSLGENSRNLADVNYTYYQIRQSLKLLNDKSIDISKLPLTLSMKSTNNVQSRFIIRCYDENGDLIESLTKYLFGTDDDIRTYPINDSLIPDGTQSIDIFDYPASTSNFPVENYNIQIEESEEFTEYRPYRYIDVFSTGKNILPDLRLESYWKTGYMPGTTNGYAYRWVNLKDYILGNNTHVTFSYDYSTVPVYFYMCSNDPALTELPEGEYKPNIYLTTNRLTTKTKTFIFNKNYDYIIYSASMFTPATFPGWLERFTYFQVEYNSSETEYEPYQEPIKTTIDLTGYEPLRKIRDEADYNDYNNKKIFRKIKKKILDGTENWLYFPTDKQFYLSTTDGVINSTYTNNSICIMSNMYKSKTFSTKSSFENNTCAMGGVGRYINIFTSEYTSIADFKNYLAEQYANGTPVIVYYLLETSIEESFDSPTIPTIKNTCVLTSSDEEIQASNIYAKYLS